GVADRIPLEIVAETEVAQHLEEGVVPGGVADVLEVVVLATGPDALLGAGRPVVGSAIEAEEDVLELVHPRVREQQGRVVRRHDRARGDDRVFLRFEEAEETLTDFGRFHRCPVPSTLICWEKSDSTEIGAKKWRPGEGA